jgi:hypothetical protein
MVFDYKKCSGMREFSFLRGYHQVRLMDNELVKEELMQALGITSRSSWYFRLYGQVEPRISEARAIEAVFEKYGITDIWGEE